MSNTEIVVVGAGVAGLSAALAVAGTGHGLCDPKAVDIFTREGAERVREFAAAGVHFDRDAHGHMLRGLEAAHSRARVVHAGGDATGKVFELDVSAMVRKNPRIHIIENAFLKDLIVRGGHIAGVHLLIDGQDKDLAADRVILAAGGAGVCTRTPPIRRSPPRTASPSHGVPVPRSPIWSSTSSIPPPWPWASTSSSPKPCAAKVRCCWMSMATGI